MLRSRTLVAGFIALTLIFAACGSDKKPAASGSGGSSAAANVKTVKVGIMFSLTGPAQSYGVESKKGAEIGIDYANEVILKDKFKLDPTYADDQSDPTHGVAVFEDLASQPDVAIIGGATLQQTAAAVAPGADDAKIPFISATGTDPTLTGASKYVWAPIPNNTDQGAAAYATVKKTANADVKKLAIIHDDRNYGKLNTESFKAEVQKDGRFEVVCDETSPFGAQTTEPQILACQNSNPDAFVGFVINPQGTVFLKDLQRLGVTKQIFGALGFADEALLGAAGSAAENMHLTTLLLASAPINDVQREFVDRFTKKFGVAPVNNDIYGFEVVTMIAQALLKANDTTRDALNAAMTDLKWTGAAGNFAVKVNHQAWGGVMTTAVVKSGKMQPVS
ncbi:MAG: branched-chain amino acid transport system substrate-binding protein [Acidimicrobiaceae bacterium]|jgi:branched-chain amino acid transport system substrate-binding protein